MAHHHIVCENPSPPSHITNLPTELTIKIVSYLTPRGIFALLIAIPAFSSVVLFAIDERYKSEQWVFEGDTEEGLHREYTPLQYFCSRGVEPVVQRLLATGADPNEIYFDDRKNQVPALVHAINFRSTRVVLLLLEHGAWVDDQNHPTPDTDTVSFHYVYRAVSPLHIAVEAANQILPRNNDQPQYLKRAVELPAIVQLLLSAGGDVHGLDGTGATALQTACAAVDTDPQIVQALIAAGSDITRLAGLNSVGRGLCLSRFYRREGNITMLHYAANAGNMAVAQILLDSGADVNARTRQGIRALDLGVLHMRTDIVEMLIQAGADVRTDVTEGLGQDRILDPFEVAKETATWDQFIEWLRLRGCNSAWRSLSQWWIQGERPGTNRRRIGQPED